MTTDSFTVDEPKLAKSIRRRMSRRVRLRHQTVPRAFSRYLIADLWPFVAEAYSAGYRAGHEDVMQARIRDAMEARDRRTSMPEGH